MTLRLNTLLALCLTLTPALAQNDAPPAIGFLMQALAKSEDPATQLNLLRGINKAMEGRRGVAAPEEWNDIAAKLSQSSSEEVRAQVQNARRGLWQQLGARGDA